MAFERLDGPRGQSSYESDDGKSSRSWYQSDNNETFIKSSKWPSLLLSLLTTLAQVAGIVVVGLLVVYLFVLYSVYQVIDASAQNFAFGTG